MSRLFIAATLNIIIYYQMKVHIMRLIMCFVTVIFFLPAEALANIRYNIINATDSPITYEVRALGQAVIKPGHTSFFTYSNESVHHMVNFSCKNNSASTMACGTYPPDDLAAFIYSGSCEVVEPNANPRIILCKN